MRTSKILPVLCVGLLLGGCGTLISGQTQGVTLLTPGTNNAKCTLDNGVKYVIYTGEKVSIMRNQKDIVLDCYAPGNRHRKMNIESHGNVWAMGDVVTGIIPGVTFDHFAKGLYGYPEVITVDFTGMPAGFETPNYFDADAPNPYEQGIENYSPSIARKDGEKNTPPAELEKKPRSTLVSPFGGPTGAGNSGSSQSVTPMPGTTSAAQPTTAPTPIVPRGATTEELNRSMNPTVFRQQ